jgi:hypothetical protein
LSAEELAATFEPFILSFRSATTAQLPSNRLGTLAAKEVLDDLDEVQIDASAIGHRVAQFVVPPRPQHLKDQGLSAVNLLDELDVVLVPPEGLHEDKVVTLGNHERQPFEAHTLNGNQPILKVVRSIGNCGE